MLEEKTNHGNQVTLIEKVLIIVLVLLTVFYIYVEYKYLANHLLEAFFFLITPALLIVLILLRFSRENKSIISLVFGIMGVVFLIINLLDRYTPLNNYMVTPMQIVSIFGLFYGINGLKSKQKNLAIVGIVFNILQFITLLIPRYQY